MAFRVGAAARAVVATRRTLQLSQHLRFAHSNSPALVAKAPTLSCATQHLSTRRLSGSSTVQGTPVQKVPVAPGKWGDLAKCSRAVRVGDTVHVAGTVGQGDTPRDQVNTILTDVIAPALAEVGASLDDVVATRMYAANVTRDWEELGAAHGEIFGETRPACTLVGAELLLDWMLVEIEVTAIVRQ